MVRRTCEFTHVPYAIDYRPWLNCDLEGGKLATGDGAPVIVYRWVRNGSGVFALVTAVTYIAALVMAVSDGAGVGVEVSRRWGTTALQTIGVGSTLFVIMWAIERVIPLIGTAVANEVAAQLEAAMVDIAERATGRAGAATAVVVKDAVTGDVMAEMLDAAVGRARTYGMVAEARATHASVAQLPRRG